MEAVSNRLSEAMPLHWETEKNKSQKTGGGRERVRM